MDSIPSNKNYPVVSIPTTTVSVAPPPSYSAVTAPPIITPSVPAAIKADQNRYNSGVTAAARYEPPPTAPPAAKHDRSNFRPSFSDPLLRHHQSQLSQPSGASTVLASTPTVTAPPPASALQQHDVTAKSPLIPNLPHPATQGLQNPFDTFKRQHMNPSQYSIPKNFDSPQHHFPIGNMRPPQSMSKVILL